MLTAGVLRFITKSFEGLTAGTIFACPESGFAAKWSMEDHVCMFGALISPKVRAKGVLCV